MCLNDIHSVQNKFGSFLLLCKQLFFFFFIVSVLLCPFSGEGTTGGFRCAHKNTSTLSSLIFSIRRLVPNLIRNNRAVYRFPKMAQLFFPPFKTAREIMSFEISMSLSVEQDPHFVSLTRCRCDSSLSSSRLPLAATQVSIQPQRNAEGGFHCRLL